MELNVSNSVSSEEFLTKLLREEKDDLFVTSWWPHDDLMKQQTVNQSLSAVIGWHVAALFSWMRNRIFTNTQKHEEQVKLDGKNSFKIFEMFL